MSSECALTESLNTPEFMVSIGAVALTENCLFGVNATRGMVLRGVREGRDTCGRDSFQQIYTLFSDLEGMGSNGTHVSSVTA